VGVDIGSLRGMAETVALAGLLVPWLSVAL
jgi:hypothetical protein